MEITAANKAARFKTLRWVFKHLVIVINHMSQVQNICVILQFPSSKKMLYQKNVVKGNPTVSDYKYDL